MTPQLSNTIKPSRGVIAAFAAAMLINGKAAAQEADQPVEVIAFQSVAECVVAHAVEQHEKAPDERPDYDAFTNLCTAAEQQALADYNLHAPRYSSLDACQQDADVCTRNLLPSDGQAVLAGTDEPLQTAPDETDYFTPAFAGFLLGVATANISSPRAVPLYRTAQNQLSTLNGFRGYQIRRRAFTPQAAFARANKVTVYPAGTVHRPTRNAGPEAAQSQPAAPSPTAKPRTTVPNFNSYGGSFRKQGPSRSTPAWSGRVSFPKARR